MVLIHSGGLTGTFPPSHRSPGRQEKKIAKFESFGEELHARQRPCRLSASGLVSGRQASKRISKGIVIVIRTRYFSLGLGLLFPSGHGKWIDRDGQCSNQCHLSREHHNSISPPQASSIRSRLSIYAIPQDMGGVTSRDWVKNPERVMATIPDPGRAGCQDRARGPHCQARSTSVICPNGIQLSTVSHHLGRDVTHARRRGQSIQVPNFPP